MPTQVVALITLLVLVVAGCAENVPTSPAISAANASAALQQAPDAGLKLHPSGFGQASFAAWKAKEGKSDDRGNGDHALYFQKMVPTATVAAGVAEIRGFDNVQFSQITGLSWEHRLDGHCGAGAPRWTVAASQGEERTFVHIGCAAALHTPAGTDDEGRVWIQDSYSAASIAVALANGLASSTNPDVNLANATIDALFIIFDEGNDVGPGFVFLDNITVAINGQATVFRGPADNGR
jgi:hypothetical protein